MAGYEGELLQILVGALQARGPLLHAVFQLLVKPVQLNDFLLELIVSLMDLEFGTITPGGILANDSIGPQE